MALYAIGDLHLSLGAPKPMDIFGGNWVGYMDKLKEDEQITFTIVDGMITSINGVENPADWSKCWMLYTDDEEYANSLAYECSKYGMKLIKSKFFLLLSNSANLFFIILNSSSSSFILLLLLEIIFDISITLLLNTIIS